MIEVYCRDKLGGAFDAYRVLHSEYGHEPHYFTHREWLQKKAYHCPGVVHTHYRDKDLGVVREATGDGLLLVIRCGCGHEYTRTLNP
jgi:hypothetical protein